MRKARTGIEMRRINLSLSSTVAERVQVIANRMVRGNISLTIENLLLKALAHEEEANEKNTDESPASV